MSRADMTEANWQAIARIFHDVHQRQAEEEAAAAAALSADDRKARVRAMAVQNARARREAADGDGQREGDPGSVTPRGRRRNSAQPAQAEAVLNSLTPGADKAG